MRLITKTWRDPKNMKNISYHIKLLCLLCTLCLPCFVVSADTPAIKQFKSGVFINRINSFDVKTGVAEVDFWYWVIADDEAPALKNLELSNGTLEALGDTISQKLDNKYYVSCRYLAHAQCPIDTSKFPFDRQRVLLAFEDSELTNDQMIFVPDELNSGIDSELHMNEWLVKGIEYQVKSHHYDSSFGYLDIPSGQGSDYSQFVVAVTLDRRGSSCQKIFKYFWAVVVSVIVGVFSLLIRVCDLDGRFGMAVGALFANVGCSFLLSEQLPLSPDLSLAESISYISLGFIMVFLIESIISLAIYNRGYEKFSKRMDICTFVISLVCYSTIWLLF